MKQDLENIFSELSRMATKPLVVQVVTLDHRQNQLMTHIRGENVDLLRAYQSAVDDFILGDKREELVRSLVFLKPDELVYCESFSRDQPAGHPKEALFSHKEEYYQAPLDKIDKAINLDSMEAPPGECTPSVPNLLTYFRKCLADYLLDDQRQSGTLVWLYSKASEKDRTSLFAIFEDELTQCRNEVIHRLHEFLQESTLSYYTARLKKQARKAAVSAVMARNLSHNVGSHALARLTSEDSLEVYGVRKIAQLNSYLRTRMDFLADVATGVPAVSMPKRLYRDVCAYFMNCENIDYQEILLDKISGTNLGGDKIKVRVISEDVQVWTDTPQIDPLVAFPNDMLGAHALYVIIENIIRNCAKHGKRLTEDTNLEISIAVDKDLGDERLFRVRIFDNIDLEPEELQSLIAKLNDAIGESILGDNGRLRDGFWGILEMKIAATYLRTIDLAEIDEDHTPPLLKATLDPANGNLGYELYLRRYRLLLILNFDNDRSLGSQYKDDLQRFGIEVTSVDEFDLDKNVEHDFLLLVRPSSGDLEWIAENRKALPQRIIVCDSRSAEGNECLYASASFEECVEAIESMTVEFISLFLWKKWIQCVIKDSSLPVLKLGNCPPGPANLDPTYTRSIVDYFAQNGDRVFFFDRHGHCSDFVVNKHSIDYYEPYGGVSPIGILITNIDGLSEEQRIQLCYEFVESGAVQVAIVDERIQGESVKRNDKNLHVPIRQVLEWMSIYVPPLEWNGENLDLNRQTYDSQLKCAIRNWIDDKLDIGVNTLVVHLGVIERLVGTDEDDISRWIEDVATTHKLKEDCRKSLIVISGRGRPANLPSDTRFLNYSLVARYLFEERSKYHLCKLLYSARRVSLAEAD